MEIITNINNLADTYTTDESTHSTSSEMNNLFETYMNALNVRNPPLLEQQQLLKAVHRVLYPQFITHYIPHNMRITNVRTNDPDISITHTKSDWEWNISEELKQLVGDTLQTRTGALNGVFVWDGTEKFALWCDAEYKIVYGFTMNSDCSKWTPTIQNMVTTIWGPLWTIQMSSFYPTCDGGVGRSNLSIFWSLRYSLLRFEGNDHKSTLKIIKDTGFTGMKNMFRKFVITS